MKKFLLFLFITGVFATYTVAQVPKDYALLVRAQVQESPASITLTWPADTNATSYSVYRKAKNTVTWTDTLAASLAANSTSYTDNNVVSGTTYEYWVKKKRTGLSAGLSAHGYVLAGIKISEVESRGKMILLVDQNYATPLAAEITQMENDLIGDGWQLIRHDVSRTASVASVKLMVSNDYSTQGNVVALFMLGHIPVPYSGSFRAQSGFNYPPDGHPDHSGAWPADVYYGVMDETMWTDNTENDATGSRTQNHNVPGDGKFDQDYMYPVNTQLQIGRVDLLNMPAFAESDTVLMKRYLDKNHAFKTGKIVAERRGFISDNFGNMGGEAFSASGWRSFTPMFGDSITNGGANQFFPVMKTNSYLWSFGCGAGTYTSAGGIGTTPAYVSDSLLNVFTMLFGSYFGDWDSQNNFLRAALAHKGWTLTSVWSGRPYWMFHPMALGENIGYCAKLTQNNIDGNTFLNPKENIGYQQSSMPTFVHVALMGDPSLRMHPVMPATGLTLSTINQQRHVVLSWTASTDNNVSGYKIYRSATRNGAYTLLGTVSSPTTTYTDYSALDGVNYYLVRAIKLENSFSGSYYNLSIGIMDTITARRYVGINTPGSRDIFTLYPNPSHGQLNVKVDVDDKPVNLVIYDISGREVQNLQWNQVQSTQVLQVPLQNLNNGVYWVKMSSSGGNSSTQKLVLIR